MTLVAPAAGCIYHKPAFQGRILDKDTKQPIEGVVVVALYRKSHMGIGTGAYTHPFHVREAVTDKDGKFSIPSYSSLIVPIWTIEDVTAFTIYKPGYASISYLALEDHFSEKKTLEEEERIVGVYGGLGLSSSYIIKSFPHGVIELPKLQTSEERKEAWMDVHNLDPDINRSDLPVFFKMIEEERRNMRF